MTFEELIRRFLEHMEIEKGASNRTLINYQHYLERFRQFMEQTGVKTPEQLVLEHVRKYRLYLNRLPDKHGNPMKRITQNYHLIALRAFLRYLAKTDIKSLPAEKIELASVEEREITFLEPEEIERLFGAVPQNNIIGLRDRAILEILFSTGLRVSELVSLEREQINLERGEFSVRGKGEKIRVVFLSPGAKEQVSKYLHARTDSNSAAFVRHGRGKDLKKVPPTRLTPRTIQRIINQYAKKAGITKHVTPHVMRHSMATDLLISGADLRSVQALLGHASVTTTQIYTHITNQQLREVHQAFHARRMRKANEKEAERKEQ